MHTYKYKVKSSISSYISIITFEAYNITDLIMITYC